MTSTGAPDPWYVVGDGTLTSKVYSGVCTVVVLPENIGGMLQMDGCFITLK